MSKLQFKDCVEWAKRGPHDDTDVALIWADKRITDLEAQLRAKEADVLHEKEAMSQWRDKYYALLRAKGGVLAEIREITETPPQKMCRDEMRTRIIDVLNKEKT